MDINEIKKKLASEEYSFLRTNPHLGKNIIILTLGGSYAYGTNTDRSDLDIRGIAVNSKREILLGSDFSVCGNTETDTVIRSFKKACRLLKQGSPSIIELLGCKPEHYFYISPIGQELLSKKDMFLSKRVIKPFLGFSKDQKIQAENTLSNYLVTDKDYLKARASKHMLHSVRSLYMLRDILEEKKIVTFREEEHDLLMNIRSGKMIADDKITDEFYELEDTLRYEIENAIKYTDLPEQPDDEAIDDFIASINERIVKGEAHERL